MKKRKQEVPAFMLYPEGVPIAIGMNPHTLRHTPLKRTCLPIPTSGQKKETMKWDTKIRISKQEEIKLLATNYTNLHEFEKSILPSENQ
jgi:hypothetical protein